MEKIKLQKIVRNLLDNLRKLYVHGTVIQKCLAFPNLQKILGSFCFSDLITLGESPKTGNTFYQLSEDIRTSRSSTPPSCALFSGGANISTAKCYFFCAWVSHVMFKRFRKCVLHPTLIVMHRQYCLPEVVSAEVLGYCKRAKDHGYLGGPCFPGVMAAE